MACVKYLLYNHIAYFLSWRKKYIIIHTPQIAQVLTSIRRTVRFQCNFSLEVSTGPLHCINMYKYLLCKHASRQFIPCHLIILLIILFNWTKVQPFKLPRMGSSIEHLIKFMFIICISPLQMIYACYLSIFNLIFHYCFLQKFLHANLLKII